MNVELSELKCKEVVNVLTGKRMGRINDLVIDCEKSCIRGIIVPGDCGFSWFKGSDNIYIPWHDIKKIGDDVILVEITVEDQVCRPCSKKDKDDDIRDID